MTESGENGTVGIWTCTVQALVETDTTSTVSGSRFQSMASRLHGRNTILFATRPHKQSHVFHTFGAPPPPSVQFLFKIKVTSSKGSERNCLVPVVDAVSMLRVSFSFAHPKRTIALFVPCNNKVITMSGTPASNTKSSNANAHAAVFGAPLYCILLEMGCYWLNVTLWTSFWGP